MPNVGELMIRFSGSAIVLALFVGFPLATLHAQTSALEWMSGCWESRTDRTVVTEQWSLPRAKTMLGAGQTTRGDSTIEYEHTRIFERDGKLVYSAQPSRQSPAEFIADSAGRSSVTFSNPTHDFPQRVIYRRLGPDSLLGRVEGKRGGQNRGVNFSYRRVSCTKHR